MFTKLMMERSANGYADLVRNLHTMFFLQHYYLSRFFGYSLYFPLCISQNLDAVYVAVLGFIPPLLMTLCVLIYIFL